MNPEEAAIAAAVDAVFHDPAEALPPAPEVIGIVSRDYRPGALKAYARQHSAEQ